MLLNVPTHQQRAEKRQKRADKAAETSQAHLRELDGMQNRAKAGAVRLKDAHNRLINQFPFQMETIETAKAMGVEFLLTELDTGHTLAALALRAQDAETAARNCQEARAAYDSVLRFIGRVRLTQEQSREVKAKLASLKKRLKQLGESF